MRREIAKPYPTVIARRRAMGDILTQLAPRIRVTM